MEGFYKICNLKAVVATAIMLLLSRMYSLAPGCPGLAPQVTTFDTASDRTKIPLCHFGSVSGLFRVRFGSVSGGVGVGLGRGASVREKNITMLGSRIF